MAAERTVLALRQALRHLIRRRNETTPVVLILGVGLGLLSAVFSLSDPFLFRPLPYLRPNELVVVRISSTALTPQFQPPSFEQWRARTDLFEGLAAHDGGQLETIRTPDGLIYLQIRRVTQNFFAVLGVPGPGVPPTVQATDHLIVLTQKGSHLLETDGNLNATVLSRANGVELKASAVLAREFLFPMSGATELDALSFFAPERVASVRRLTGAGSIPQLTGPTLLARLKPNVSLERVRRELAATLAGGGRLEVSVTSLSEVMTAKSRSYALGVFLAGVLLLLVCLGNVCSLVIAQQSHRAHEAGIRRALGARRRDLVTESVLNAGVLMSASAVVALMIANGIIAASSAIMPRQFVSLGAPSLTLRCGWFSLFAAVIVGAILTIPMLRSERTSGQNLMSHKPSSKVRDSRGVRIWFGAFQATLAVIFAIGAGMLGQSYINLVSQDEGFSGRVYTTQVHYPFQRASSLVYGDVQTTLAQLRLMPGVLTVAATIGPLVNGVEASRSMVVNGTAMSVSYSQVTKDFFEAAGIPILRGRPLGQADEGNRAVVVNQSFSRSYFPDPNNHVGQVVIQGPYRMDVVGVVRDVIDKRLDAKPEPTVYGLMDPDRIFPAIAYVIKCSDDATVHASLVRQKITQVNPEAMVFPTEALSARLSATVRDKVFASFALTLFGVASVSITILGLVGIVSFVTAKRSRELAIRMALGASAVHIRWVVSKEAAIAAVAGCAAGIVVGQPLSHLLASLAYGVEAGSWLIAFSAALFTLGLMLGSSLLTAARVNRIQPAEALRRD